MENCAEEEDSSRWRHSVALRMTLSGARQLSPQLSDRLFPRVPTPELPECGGDRRQAPDATHAQPDPSDPALYRPCRDCSSLQRNENSRASAPPETSHQPAANLPGA